MLPATIRFCILSWFRFSVASSRALALSSIFDDDGVGAVGFIHHCLNALDIGKGLLIVIAQISGAEDADDFKGTHLPGTGRQGNVVAFSSSRRRQSSAPTMMPLRFGNQVVYRSDLHVFLDRRHIFHVGWDHAVEDDGIVFPAYSMAWPERGGRLDAGAFFQTVDYLFVSANAARFGERLDRAEFDHAIFIE